MKYFAFLSAFLLFGLASISIADEAPIVTEESIFNYDITYTGPFEAEQLYVRYEKPPFWYANKQISRIEQIKCGEASSGIQLGVWVGNISDEGKCQDPGEAPQWTSGNYLNFLYTKTAGSQQTQ